MTQKIPDVQSPSYVEKKLDVTTCIILPRFIIGSKNKRLSINVPKIHYDIVVPQLGLRLRIEATDLDRQECLSLTFRIADNLTAATRPLGRSNKDG